MNVSFLIITSILLPVFFGLLIYFFRPFQKPTTQRILFIAVLILNSILIFVIILTGETRLELFRFNDRLPILFITDGPARLFCSFSSLAFLIVGIFTPAYMKNEGGEGKFFMFYLLVLGMLIGFGFSGNLMTLYLFFEVMTLFSVPLVMHSLKKETVAAAFRFFYYSIAGASLALFGFFFLLAYGTTLEFTAGGILDMQKLSGNEGLMLTAALLTIIGFSTKAGMFPMHAWLPAAHPVAPSPASAVLSGVITKAGIFAVFRFIYYLVGPEFIRGTWVQTVWISLTLFTIVMGSLLAFHEKVLKRQLAYSSVSQVSYILFGLAILTSDGLTGAMLHMVFHSIVKCALFLIAGVIILKTGITETADLKGIGKQMPVTMWSFALLAIAAVGIPPTSGFISKWYLITGSLSLADTFITWICPAVLLLSALLTAGYMFPIAYSAFFTGKIPENNHIGTKPSVSMMFPILLLTVLAVVTGIFPNALISFIKVITGLIL